MKTMVSAATILQASCLAFLLSGATPARAQQDPQRDAEVKRALQPYYSGSRVLGMNNWISIKARAESGEPFAIAVRAMRRSIAEGRWADARKAFDEAVSLKPLYAPYTEWADTLAARGDVPGALALYRHVLSDPEKYHGTLQGSPPPAMVMRYCLLLLRAGQRKAAAEAYQWGFDLTEQRLASHGARDLFDLKPTSRSADLKELRAAAHTVIGLTNLEARTWDEHRMPPDVAIAEYRKALAAKPDFDIARIFLGKAYKEKEFLEPGSGQLAAEAWRAAARSSNEVVRAKARELLGKP